MRISWPVTSSRSAGDQRVEQFERLGLVFVERVALGDAAPADHLAQMIEHDEMLAPQMVERLQHHLLFDVAGQIRRILLFAGGVGLVGGLFQPVPHFLVADAFFLGPVGERRLDIELRLDLLGEARDVPGFGIGVVRECATR